MSTGEGKPKGTGKSRRRAVRPPTIEGKAREIATPDTAPDAVPETVKEDPGAAASETAAREIAAPEIAAREIATGEWPVDPAGSAAPGTGSPAPGPEAGAAEPDTARPAEVVDAPAPGDDAHAEAALAAHTGDEAGADDSEPPESAKPDVGQPDAAGPDAGAAPAEPGLTEPEMPAPLPTARRASLIGAGVIGALIALALYLGLYYGGVLPRDNSAVLDNLLTQIQDVSRRTAALESNAAREPWTDTTKAISARIDEVESALKELGSDPKNSFARRLSSIESQFKDLGTSLQSAALPQDIQARIGDLEDKLSSLGADAGSAAGAAADDLGARLDDQQERIAALEAAPAPAPAPADDQKLSDISQRIAALDQQMQETRTTVAELAKSGAESTQSRLADIDAALTRMRGDLQSIGGAVSGVTKDVGDKLAAFRTEITDRDTSETRRMARSTASALAMTALEKAVDGGGAYEGELKILGPLVDDTADLSVLETYAAAGVPNADMLEARFVETVAPAIVDAGQTDGSGVVGSLLTSARSLVSVRPAGDVSAEGEAGTVARMEAALEAGDLTTAQTEWASLDPAARQISKAWADDLEARIAVNEALASLSAAITASVSGAAAPAQN
jgi:hypothetical protein